jgi:hypothetical protein
MKGEAMKKLLPIFFCLILFSLPLCVNASTLTISVSTITPIGRFYDSTISGALTLDGTPVTDGLAAIQVMSPSDDILLLRTVNTGANPTSFVAEIETVYPSDSEGNPKSDFTPGELAYFTVTAVNNDVSSRTVMIAISIFDNNNCPIGYAATTSVMGHESKTATLSIPTPTWAGSGRATVFAAAYTELPSLGGTPYCSEESDVFTINNQQGESPPTTPTGNQGQYTLSFKVQPKADTIGTYRVYVSSLHSGFQAFSSTTFTVYQPGDFNGDLIVNYVDISSFVDAYIDYWSGDPFDSKADFDNNEKVDYRDISAFVDAYITYWSY